MTTTGDSITKASFVAGMASLYTAYNRNIVWHSENNPFQNTAIPLAGGNANGYAHITESDISDTNVTASTITTNFRAYATQLSRIRNARLLKWYQIQGDVRASLSSDVSNITSLNSDFQYDFVATAYGAGPSSDTLVSASALDSFVSALSTEINANRTSTVTIEEFYCHSNCHGSCHGSI